MLGRSPRELGSWTAGPPSNRGRWSAGIRWPADREPRRPETRAVRCLAEVLRFRGRLAPREARDLRCCSSDLAGAAQGSGTCNYGADPVARHISALVSILIAAVMRLNLLPLT